MLYGDINYYGVITGEENYKEALNWYKLSAEQNYLPSFYKLGDTYIELYGPNSKGAHEWYIKAMENNSPVGQYECAKYYMEGLGVEQSTEKAVELYFLSAKAGYPLSEAQIGKYYEDGSNGLPLDINEAIKWYKKAAEHDIYGPLYQLACIYRDGYGVDRNYNLALKYMKKAAEHNQQKAKDGYKELQKKGAAYYNSLPKRINIEDCLIKDYEDPFMDVFLGVNQNLLPLEDQRVLAQEFKIEKIRQWGKERAEKVAKHMVEIGFSEDQVKFSQGNNPLIFKTQTVHFPDGELRIIEYPHCIYYFLHDKLIAMLWDNGMQIGDKRAIRTYKGDIVITEGNK